MVVVMVGMVAVVEVIVVMMMVVLVVQVSSYISLSLFATLFKLKACSLQSFQL